ncbi:protein kinase [Rhodococcus jostii]|uniref:protein kinase domain-containing protein n=1 Tax=Rhodococcus jostii TaxID=132919 RepID=UPI003642757F
MQREYSLLSSLRHESIVVPRDLVQDDDGNTVLVYPETPGFEPLDLALATRTLTAEQQLLILTQIAEALAYAHRNHVAHRGLGPSTVLIDTDALDVDTVRVRLTDWSWAGRVHTGDTRSATMLGTSVAPGGAPRTRCIRRRRIGGPRTPTGWRWTCSPSVRWPTSCSRVVRPRPVIVRRCSNGCGRNRAWTWRPRRAGSSTSDCAPWCCMRRSPRCPSGWRRTRRRAAPDSGHTSWPQRWLNTGTTGS